MSDRLVIIPTYNEKENIERIIRKVFSLNQSLDILIIDDGSPDGTADIVRKLQQEYPAILHLEERKGKLGLGTAYIHGFKWGLARNYQYLFEMDADFSHNPEDLPRLLAPLLENRADVSVGSRYCEGGKVRNWPVNRILMSYFASVYVRAVLWISVMDTTAGFKCYKAEVLRALDLDNIKFIGYAFQIEMKYRAIRKGFRITEVPITFIDRQQGVSKMSMNIFREAFWGVLKMRFTI